MLDSSQDHLEKNIGELLTHLGLTLATAESCSGGLIANRITNIPGSSNYFERGLITYSNEAKIELLNVPAEVIDRFGAVSPETGEAMAKGIRDLAKSTLGLGVTGIAGPTGGTLEKPVGLVYIVLATPEGVVVHENRFKGTRLEIKHQTSEAALKIIFEYLKNLK